MNLYYIEHGDLDDLEEGDRMRAVIAARTEHEARTLALLRERRPRQAGWRECICTVIGEAKKGTPKEIVLDVVFGPNR